MDTVNARGYGSHTHLGVWARVRISRVDFRGAKVSHWALAVPELTRGTGIQVNERV